MATNLDKVIACLSFLELRPNMRDYKWRFFTQKTAFLAKTLGMNISYDFIIDVAGPYSRQLNCDYYPFETKERIDNLETSYHLNLADRVVLLRIQHCKGLYRDQQLMEATSTIVYLIKERNIIDDGNLLIRMKALKPHLRDTHRIIGLTRAKELLFREEYLTPEIRREMETWDNI